jgi:hypothetical protein
MATYKVRFNPDRGAYEVELDDDAGGRTVLGSETEAEAQARIEENRRTNVCVLPVVEHKTLA